MVASCHRMVSNRQSTTWWSPSLSRDNTGVKKKKKSKAKITFSSIQMLDQLDIRRTWQTNKLRSSSSLSCWRAYVVWAHVLYTSVQLAFVGKSSSAESIQLIAVFVWNPILSKLCLFGTVPFSLWASAFGKSSSANVSQLFCAIVLMNHCRAALKKKILSVCCVKGSSNDAHDPQAFITEQNS